jgi:hypothetical protein
MSEFIRFREGDKVTINRSMYTINSGEKKEHLEFKATIYKDSTIENQNGVKHYLLFEGKQTPPLPKDLFYKDVDDTKFTYKKLELMPGRQTNPFHIYRSEFGFKGNYNKLQVEFKFPTYSAWIDKYIYYTEKIRPTHLVEGRTRLKTRRQSRSNSSKVFYKDPATNTRHSVLKTNKIKELERKIQDHQYFCEDRISKYYQELDAEIEMQYNKNKGKFRDTIHRLKGNKTHSRVRTTRKNLTV